MTKLAMRRAAVFALLLLSPALAGCSSSAPQRESAATNTYPQQARAASPQSAPAVLPAMTNVSAAAPDKTGPGAALAGLTPPHSVLPPAPTPAPIAPAQPALASAAAQPTAAPSTPAGATATEPATTDDDFDAAASAYPSVALFDLIRQSANPTPQVPPGQVSPAQVPPAQVPPAQAQSVQAQSANRPLVSDMPQATTGQRTVPAAQSAATTNAPATQSAAATKPAPAASSSDDDFDAAASAYPSVALFDLFRNSKPSQ